MTQTPATFVEAREQFLALVAAVRPELHRYCARMIGSVVDGEDVLQEALVKATEAFAGARPDNPEAWLFRIAHNTALDHLRRRARQGMVAAGEEDLEMVASPVNDIVAREAAAASLRSFMRLPASQRSANTVMPWRQLGGMTRDDLRAIYAYLRSTKPVIHRVRKRDPISSGAGS